MVPEWTLALDLTPLENDGGSWDELAEAMGIRGMALRTGRPGDLYDLEHDVQLYWPRVRECYQEPRP